VAGIRDHGEFGVGDELDGLNGVPGFGTRIAEFAASGNSTSEIRSSAIGVLLPFLGSRAVDAKSDPGSTHRASVPFRSQTEDSQCLRIGVGSRCVPDQCVTSGPLTRSRRLSRQIYADQLQLARVPDLLEEWQAAARRAFREIPCRWLIPRHGRKQFESALRDYSARQSHQQSRANYADSDWPHICLGLFAAAEALGLGFVHGVPPVLYVERIEAELIERLGISQERAREADIYLRVPAHKESIFRAAVDQKGIFVSDVLQVWLDSSNHPSRGSEQDDRIRDEVLRPLLSP
jgi:hypothetical protein